MSPSVRAQMWPGRAPRRRCANLWIRPPQVGVGPCVAFFNRDLLMEVRGLFGIQSVGAMAMTPRRRMPRRLELYRRTEAKVDRVNLHGERAAYLYRDLSHAREQGTHLGKREDPRGHVYHTCLACRSLRPPHHCLGSLKIERKRRLHLLPSDPL